MSEIECERCAPLTRFLSEHGAIQVTEIGKLTEGAYTWQYQGWRCRSRTFIVVLLKGEESGEEGFEVFLPASRHNSVQATLDELERYVYS